MTDELKSIAQGLNSNYNELLNTVNKIGDLKDIIKNLTVAGNEIKESFDEILSNEKLESFKKSNQESTNELKKNLGQIERNMKDILMYRSVFVNMIDTYQERFEKFENKVKEEIEATEKLQKLVNQMMARMENEYATLNKKMERFTQIIEASDIIRAQDKILNEIRENRKEINKLANIKNNNQPVNKVDNKPKDFNKNISDPYKMNQNKPNKVLEQKKIENE